MGMLDDAKKKLEETKDDVMENVHKKEGEMEGRRKQLEDDEEKREDEAYDREEEFPH
jgi:hypothetical protein